MTDPTPTGVTLTEQELGALGCRCDQGASRDPSKHTSTCIAPVAVQILTRRLAKHDAKVRAEAARDAADFVESLRVHTDTSPESDCPDGCGWFNYAAMKLRDRAQQLGSEAGS